MTIEEHIDLIDFTIQFSNVYNCLSYFNCGMFTIGNVENNTIKITFTNQVNAPISIPVLNSEQVKYSSKFYITEYPTKLFNIYEMLNIVIGSRLTDYSNNYRFINLKRLRSDITLVCESLCYNIPFSLNNQKKLEGRVRVISLTSKDGKIFDSIGESLWSINAKTEYEDIENFSKIFNDPIAVSSLTKGTYCKIQEPYNAVGYYSDSDSITSLYPIKSNLPERLRQHYTSAYLQPLNPDIDYLNKEAPLEKVNLYTVFCPVNFKETVGIESKPLKDGALLAGELLISQNAANKQFYVRRTFTVDNADFQIVSIGQIINPGDTLAWDLEGFPVLKYKLNYKNALVVDVIKQQNKAKIIIEVLSELGVARLISEYGIKGVTHPCRDLGYITIDNNTVPVDLVAGSTSVKSLNNGIYLAWWNYHQSLKKEPISIKPNINTAEEFQKSFPQLKKCIWTYNNEEHEVYVGLVSVGVTDLAQDCQSTGVRISPETLKYMYLHGDKLSLVADMLLSKYTSTRHYAELSQLLNLKQEPKEDDIIFSYDDASFLISLQTNYFIDNHSVIHGNKLSLLLKQDNHGFYVDFHGNLFKFPSAALIESFTFINNGLINYPLFYSSANSLLFLLKNYNLGKATDEQVLAGYESYIGYVNEAIFGKKKALNKALIPKCPGGHLKQLVSPYVPTGVTVICDNSLIGQIRRFKRTYKGPIYEIGVRNPVLWSFQLRPRKVWTINQFEHYLEKNGYLLSDIFLPEYLSGAVIRNTYDTLLDKADTDGDLYPVTIPLDSQIQDALSESAHVHIRDYEKEWISNYIKGELDKNEKLTGEKFEFYTINRSKFATLMSDAAIAKTKVGSATVDLWMFHTACEVRYLNGDIDYETMHRLMFTISNIVQSFVVEGIKHNSGGSSGYDLFTLRTVKYNKDDIQLVLQATFGLTPELSNEYINTALLATDPSISLLSRLTTGSSNVNKFITNLTTFQALDKNLILNISYCKIFNHLYTLLK